MGGGTGNFVDSVVRSLSLPLLSYFSSLISLFFFPPPLFSPPPPLSFHVLFLFSSPLSAFSLTLPEVVVDDSHWVISSQRDGCQGQCWETKPLTTVMLFLPFSLFFSPGWTKDVDFSATVLWWSGVRERGNRKQMGLDLITPGVQLSEYQVNLWYHGMEHYISGCRIKSSHISWFFRYSLLRRGLKEALQPSVCFIARKIAVFQISKAWFVLAELHVPGNGLVWPGCPEGGSSTSHSSDSRGNWAGLKSLWARQWETKFFSSTPSLPGYSSAGKWLDSAHFPMLGGDLRNHRTLERERILEVINPTTDWCSSLFSASALYWTAAGMCEVAHQHLQFQKQLWGLENSSSYCVSISLWRRAFLIGLSWGLF